MRNSNNLILNNFFSRATFKSLLTGKKNSRYNTCIKRYVSNISKLTNEEAISEVYKYLDANYRNEYFYKNTLMNKLLLGKHSLKTTTALTEIPINKSKADYIMINGEATVYEIKTELDNFDRLEYQLKDYYKGFKNVCVVTSENNYNEVLKILRDTNVGIYVLTDRNTLSYRKEIVSDTSNLQYDVIFKMLRKYEFEDIILRTFGFLPEVSSFEYYDECFKVLSSIEIEDLHYLMIKQLKNRVSIDIDKYQEIIPYELKFIMYFLNLKVNEYKMVENFLNAKLEG